MFRGACGWLYADRYVAPGSVRTCQGTIQVAMYPHRNVLVALPLWSGQWGQLAWSIHPGEPTFLSLCPAFDQPSSSFRLDHLWKKTTLIHNTNFNYNTSPSICRRFGIFCLLANARFLGRLDYHYLHYSELYNWLTSGLHIVSVMSGYIHFWQLFYVCISRSTNISY